MQSDTCFSENKPPRKVTYILEIKKYLNNTEDLKKRISKAINEELKNCSGINQVRVKYVSSIMCEEIDLIESDE